MTAPASEMAAPWMAASDPSYFADFEQVKIFSSHFATLSRSKLLVVILLTLSRSKKLAKKLPWKKLDAYASFFGHGLMSPALPGFSDL